MFDRRIGHLQFCDMYPTVDGSEIPNNHWLDAQNSVNNGRNYQPQLVSWISAVSNTLWFRNVETNLLNTIT